MKIKLRHKGAVNKRSSGFIQSGDMGEYCNIHLNYKRHPKILEDIKKTLSKYYDFDIENHNIKKAPGSLTRSFTRKQNKRKSK